MGVFNLRRLYVDVVIQTAWYTHKNGRNTV
jgi:hypothetical protein